MNMDRSQVMSALEAVNAVLKSKGQKATVVITGGAAIMFQFPNFPREVKDLDGGYMSPELQVAVEQVTWEKDLADGWFNDTSKDYYAPKSGQTVPGPQFSNLSIQLPSKNYLLCLKIMSGRPEEKANDPADVEFMIMHMPNIQTEKDWQDKYVKFFGKSDWKPYTAEAARRAIEAKSGSKVAFSPGVSAAANRFAVQYRGQEWPQNDYYKLAKEFTSDWKAMVKYLEEAGLVRISDAWAKVISREEAGDMKSSNLKTEGGTPIKTAKAPYKLQEFEGFTILIGRSAIENDVLSFEVAQPNDFWFHVAGSPGSHIVVRNPENLKELPGPVAQQVKQLAIHNSKARGTSAEVHWGFAKNLSKPKGSADGEVNLDSWKKV